MTQREKTLYEAEALVKSILTKRGNVDLRPETVRGAAEKMVKALPREIQKQLNAA